MIYITEKMLYLVEMKFYKTERNIYGCEWEGLADIFATYPKD
jgi:hypothetical protein